MCSFEIIISNEIKNENSPSQVLIFFFFFFFKYKFIPIRFFLARIKISRYFFASSSYLDKNESSLLINKDIRFLTKLRTRNGTKFFSLSLSLKAFGHNYCLPGELRAVCLIAISATYFRA